MSTEGTSSFFIASIQEQFYVDVVELLVTTKGEDEKFNTCCVSIRLCPITENLPLLKSLF